MVFNRSWAQTKENIGQTREGIRTGAQAAYGFGQSFNRRLGTSMAGRSLQISAAESFGFYYEGGFNPNKVKARGFLGLKHNYNKLFGDYETRSGAQRVGYRDVYRAERRMGAGPLAARRTAMSSTKMLSKMGSFGLKTAWAAVPAIGTAVYAYQGYQQEGMWGAAKGVGSSIAIGAGMRMAAGVLGGAALATAGVGLAAGAGVYALGEAAQAHRQNLTQLEMGQGQFGPFTSAAAATMRQRSLMALQNTHLNARMALGNEAMLMHSSVR